LDLYLGSLNLSLGFYGDQGNPSWGVSLTLNYTKLANIEQEEKEAPGKFLDRLREVLSRFTEIDPESEE